MLKNQFFKKQGPFSLNELIKLVSPSNELNDMIRIKTVMLNDQNETISSLKNDKNACKNFSIATSLNNSEAKKIQKRYCY